MPAPPTARSERVLKFARPDGWLFQTRVTADRRPRLIEPLPQDRKNYERRPLHASWALGDRASQTPSSTAIRAGECRRRAACARDEGRRPLEKPPGGVDRCAAIVSRAPVSPPVPIRNAGRSMRPPAQGLRFAYEDQCTALHPSWQFLRVKKACCLSCCGAPGACPFQKRFSIFGR